MDCVSIPSIEYSDFSKRLQGKSINSRLPVNGAFDITSRCNLRCIHCYIRGTSFGDELTYPEICNILDQIADEGCLWLLLTGGEPLTRPDFTDIYKYAKKKGFFITLFTNGTLVTPEIADLLTELPPFAVEISLYGMTADIYEKITGVPGSFEQCLRGIELLRGTNLHLKLKSVMMTTNYHQVTDMRRYADSIGVPFRHDCLINARLDGSMEILKLRLSPDTIVALDMAFEKQVKAWQDYIERYGNVPSTDNLYYCGAGMNSFHISSTGQLNVCMVSREPGYDLRRGTFRDGFYNVFPGVRARKRKRFSECPTCDLKGICDQCPAWGQLEHGDPEARVDFLCQVTKRRVAALRGTQNIQVKFKS
jgi:radical SAM protein with 4Fe4S-binding SPASM domain